MAAHIGGDQVGEIVAPVVHGQHDALESSLGLSARCTRSIVRISWLRPSSAKNSHCSGTSTASAATSALIVSRFSEGGQSIRTSS